VNLSPTEREVLVLASRGHSDKLIGREMDISYLTVKGHLSSVYRKLEARNRVHAVVKALRLGLLPEEA
jgi:DNA-binding CsgD family transcriptional regulator